MLNYERNAGTNIFPQIAQFGAWTQQCDRSETSETQKRDQSEPATNDDAE